MSRSDGLDQAIFGNKGGVGLTASTAPDQDGRWNHLLDGYVRLTSFNSQPPPEQALSYLRLAANEVAVLHRYQDPHGSPGRSPAQALIGDPRVLTVPVALGLAETWPTLPSENGRPLMVGVPSIVDIAKQQQSTLRQRAAQERPVLVKILAGIIADPNRNVAVLECPQGATGAVMWGLHAIGDPYLREVHGVSRDWTFSTYETTYPADLRQDQDQGWDRVPAIVFLPGRPGASTTSRTVVSLRADASAGTRATETAQRLVDLFCAGEQVDYSQFEPPRLHEDETDGMYRRPREVATTGRQNEMAGAGSRTGAGGGGVGGSSTPMPPPETPIREGGGRGPVERQPSFSTGSNGSHGGATDIVPTLSSPPREPSPAVGEVIAARGPADLLARLDRLVSDHPDQPRRRTLRNDMVQDSTVNEVLAAIAVHGGDQGTRARRRLVDALFGPEHADLDTSHGQQSARALVAASSSDDFVDVLLEAVAKRNGGYAPVGSAIAQRHLALRGLPLYEPPPVTDPLKADGERRSGAGAEPPYRNLLLMAAAGVGAVLVLVIGFFLGSWTTADAAPATPTTPTGQASPPAGNDPAQGARVPVYQAKRDEVVLVVKVQPDGNYVKVADCTPGDNGWTCPFESGTSVLHLTKAELAEPITAEVEGRRLLARFG